jgi:hypothetical protein
MIRIPEFVYKFGHEDRGMLITKEDMKKIEIASADTVARADAAAALEKADAARDRLDSVSYQRVYPSLTG